MRNGVKSSTLPYSEVLVMIRGSWHLDVATSLFHGSASLNSKKEGTFRVWSWGRGDAGQLGHGVEDPEWEPRCIEALTEPANEQLDKVAH